MNFDIQTITKSTFGFFMGVSIGLLFRYFLLRITLYAAIPIIVMLALDYTGMFSVDWLFLKVHWEGIFGFLTPPVINIYNYLNNHVMLGLVHGILIGLTSRFFFMRR